MLVGDVIKLNEGLDIIIEVHFTEHRLLYGHNILAHVTKTNVFDSLSPYRDKIVKYVYCKEQLAPIYDILATINCKRKMRDFTRTIQLYI